jgi:hypothetical protein
MEKLQTSRKENEMKITPGSTKPEGFQPVSFKVRIDTEAEFDTFRDLTNANVRIPDVMYTKSNGYVVGNGNHAIVVSFLNSLSTALDEIERQGVSTRE